MLGKRQKQWIGDIPKYEQAHNTLKNGRSFCCLGVYVETQLSGEWCYGATGNPSYTDRNGNPQSGILGEADALDLGLRDSNGSFSDSIKWKEKWYLELTVLNDSELITPAEMAKFIADNAEFIFTEPK